MQILQKVGSLVGLHFDYFSAQAWLFGITYPNFYEDLLENEVSKKVVNVAYQLKTHKVSVSGLHKIAIFRKTESFGTFCADTDANINRSSTLIAQIQKE